MRRTSQDLASLIDIVTRNRSEPYYWLPALHILHTVEGVLSPNGRPHHLLKYIDLDAPGIRFREMLDECHFTGAQRQAILVAWELFNGGDRSQEERAEFHQVVFRLDSANFQAVMDGMLLRTQRDRSGRIQRRLLEWLGSVLEAWEEAGL